MNTRITPSQLARLAQAAAAAVSVPPHLSGIGVHLVVIAVDIGDGVTHDVQCATACASLKMDAVREIIRAMHDATVTRLRSDGTLPDA